MPLLTQQDNLFGLDPNQVSGLLEQEAQQQVAQANQGNNVNQLSANLGRGLGNVLFGGVMGMQRPEVAQAVRTQGIKQAVEQDAANLGIDAQSDPEQFSRLVVKHAIAAGDMNLAYKAAVNAQGFSMQNRTMKLREDTKAKDAAQATRENQLISQIELKNIENARLKASLQALIDNNKLTDKTKPVSWDNPTGLKSVSDMISGMPGFDPSLWEGGSDGTDYKNFVRDITNEADKLRNGEMKGIDPRTIAAQLIQDKIKSGVLSPGIDQPWYNVTANDTKVKYNPGAVATGQDTTATTPVNKSTAKGTISGSSEEDTIRVLAPDGKTIGTIPKANKDKALKAGYKLL